MWLITTMCWTDTAYKADVSIFTIYYGPYLIVKARKDDLMVVYIHI